MTGQGILGTGAYVPAVVVSNDEVARAAGVTASWIERKTGVRERRRALPSEAASDLAARAAERALAQAGLAAGDLSVVIVATSTPDHPQPPTASIVQDLIGARGAAAFDLNGVCSGFVYALEVGRSLLAAGRGAEHALVIGVDVYSRIVDPTDRRTAVLFGDGAGAVVLGPVPDGYGLSGAVMAGEGAQRHLIEVPAGGSRLPSSVQTLAEGAQYFRMDGRGVRDFVRERVPDLVSRVIEASGHHRDAVDHFIPHQANGVLLEELWGVLGLAGARMHLTVREYGNTGSASVPITLDTAHRRGELSRGDVVLLAGFGGGMNTAAALMTWSCAPAGTVPPARLHRRSGAGPRRGAPPVVASRGPVPGAVRPPAGAGEPALLRPVELR